MSSFLLNIYSKGQSPVGMECFQMAVFDGIGWPFFISWWWHHNALRDSSRSLVKCLALEGWDSVGCDVSKPASAVSPAMARSWEWPATRPDSRSPSWERELGKDYQVPQGPHCWAGLGRTRFLDWFFLLSLRRRLKNSDFLASFKNLWG